MHDCSQFVAVVVNTSWKINYFNFDRSSRRRSTMSILLANHISVEWWKQPWRQSSIIWHIICYPQLWRFIYFTYPNSGTSQLSPANLYADPVDLQALTPGHFLAGRTVLLPPEADYYVLRLRCGNINWYLCFCSWPVSSL